MPLAGAMLRRDRVLRRRLLAVLFGDLDGFAPALGPEPPNKYDNIVWPAPPSPGCVASASGRRADGRAVHLSGEFFLYNQPPVTLSVQPARSSHFAATASEPHTCRPLLEAWGWRTWRYASWVCCGQVKRSWELTSAPLGQTNANHRGRPSFARFTSCWHQRRLKASTSWTRMKRAVCATQTYFMR